MKIIRLCLFLTASCFFSAKAQAEPSAPLSAAVLDFQTSGEKLAKKGSEVGLLLNAQLSAAPSLILVERQELEKILGEQELGLSGTVAPESVAKVGALTGAKVLITGRLFESGDKLFLVAKIMSTETSRVFGETATFSNLDALDKATAELAGKIGAVVEKQAGNLVAKTEDLPTRIERLKKIIAGHPLPSVAITIAEQHLERPVIDPAAETEMRLVLQQLGFVVIDPKTSTQQPDMLVSGEAFSELGGRRGNLVFCRARIEIKLLRGAAGGLIWSDRQTDSGIDLAEHVAGKNALENAALKLLDRLVPKLVAP